VATKSNVVLQEKISLSQQYTRNLTHALFLFGGVEMLMTDDTASFSAEDAHIALGST
jgi:hypothetical protein